MEVKRVCHRCGEINTINSENLISVDVWDEDNVYYKLMYFDCKRCRERIAVQIDSFESLTLFRELKALTIKVARKKLKHETISPKDIKKKDKWTKQLKEKREMLKELCSGKKLFDENKKVVIECLTFPKVGDIIESNL